MRLLRTIGSFWRIAYSASTLRRFGYAVLALPLSVVCLLLALTGQAQAAARYQRRLASRLASVPVAEAGSPQRGAPAPRRMGARVAAHAVASLPLGLACWAVLQFLAFMLLFNLAYPVRNYLEVGGSENLPLLPWAALSVVHGPPRPGGIWASTYHAWGGPTLAGVWAVHAGLVLVSSAPLLAWVVRGLTRLQGGLTRTLLGATPPGRTMRSSGAVRPARR